MIVDGDRGVAVTYFKGSLTLERRATIDQRAPDCAIVTATTVTIAGRDGLAMGVDLVSPFAACSAAGTTGSGAASDTDGTT